MMRIGTERMWKRVKWELRECSMVEVRKVVRRFRIPLGLGFPSV